MKNLLLTLSAAALVALPVSAVADWSDNFDAYAPGGLAGNGGWAIWYSGGVDGTVTTEQARSAPHSVRIDADSDVTNVMGGPYAAGHFMFTGWSYLPPTGTGQVYLIFLNTYNPGDNWSAQVLMDMGLNCVYDIGTSGPSLAMVRGRWAEFTVEIDLDNDFQRVTYDGNELYTDSWTGHMAPVGTATLAVVDLYSSGSPTPCYWDDLSLRDLGATPVEPTSWGQIKATFR